MWYLYILSCKDGAFYTGVTDNLERRFKEHQSGKGGHYTGYNRPVEMVYSERFESQSNAQNRERQIKRWSRAKKLALIKSDRKSLIFLSKSRD